MATILPALASLFPNGSAQNGKPLGQVIGGIHVSASSDIPKAVEPHDDRFVAAYAELRHLAARQLHRERGARTLQPTALVHEAYLKLGGRGRPLLWESEAHFIGCAARAMRQVLVDYARRGRAAKRRGERVDWTLSSIPQADVVSPDDFLAIDQALTRLSQQPPNGARHARLVELIWFGGMDMTSAALELGICRRQAHRDWAWARTWLRREMGD